MKNKQTYEYRYPRDVGILAPDLNGRTRNMFQIIANKLHNGSIKKAHDLFVKGINGKICGWDGTPKGKILSLDAQIDFTVRLIRICCGCADESDMSRDNKEASTEYRTVMNAIKVDTKSANELDGLAGELKRYLAYLYACHGTIIAPRFPALFPGYIGEIISLIKGAKSSIMVYTDAIDHGSFRDFALHRLLVDELIEKAKSDSPISVRILVIRFLEPISLANQYALDTNRTVENGFEDCLRIFLHALRDFTNLENTDPYREIQALLGNGVDWTDPNGEITKVLDLQDEVQKLEHKEMTDANVKIKSVAQKSGMLLYPEARDSNSANGCHNFYWIVDEMAGIVVNTSLGTDAIARYMNHEELTQHTGAFRRIMLS